MQPKGVCHYIKKGGHMWHFVTSAFKTTFQSFYVTKRQGKEPSQLQRMEKITEMEIQHDCHHL